MEWSGLRHALLFPWKDQAPNSTVEKTPRLWKVFGRMPSTQEVHPMSPSYSALAKPGRLVLGRHGRDDRLVQAPGSRRSFANDPCSLDACSASVGGLEPSGFVGYGSPLHFAAWRRGATFARPFPPTDPRWPLHDMGSQPGDATDRKAGLRISCSDRYRVPPASRVSGPKTHLVPIATRNNVLISSRSSSVETVKVLDRSPSLATDQKPSRTEST